MTYIILSAGKGVKLQPLTLNHPKSLYKLDDNITSDDFYIPEKEAHSDFDIKLFNYYSLENKEYKVETVVETPKKKCFLKKLFSI